jgi:sugar lactone lactonase YvrE
LFITSAKEGEPDKYPESAKFGGNLFRVDVGVEGMPKYEARLY